MEVTMSLNIRNRRFSRIIAAVVGAVGLAALTIPLAPAQAQLYFGFGPGGFGVGIGAPYYYSPYYAPYYYPPYPYYGW
jgi:hypothetical protein